MVHYGVTVHYNTSYGTFCESVNMPLIVPISLLEIIRLDHSGYSIEQTIFILKLICHKIDKYSYLCKLETN